MRFFKMDVDAFVDGVKTLTPAERGAYVTILCEMYRTDHSVKLSLEEWAKLMGCSKTRAFEHIETLIAAGKLCRDDNGALRNERAHAEIMQVRTASVLKETARSFRSFPQRSAHRTKHSARRTDKK